MVSSTRVSGGDEDYLKASRLKKSQLLEVDARSDGLARTVDEALDLEALIYMAATNSTFVYQYENDEYGFIDCGASNVSGLPLVCSNCGVSFFSLQISNDQLDCYCSGECKWSVIMYREMDQRMFAIRQPMHHHSLLDIRRFSINYYEDSDEEQNTNCAFFSVCDELTASSSCC